MGKTARYLSVQPLHTDQRVPERESTLETYDDSSLDKLICFLLADWLKRSIFIEFHESVTIGPTDDDVSHNDLWLLKF